jgi:hypothetical protein
LLLAAAAGSVLAQAPPWLDILKAEVREVPPSHPIDVGSRTVAIDLTLAGSPVCTGSSPFVAYGILIDADLDPDTGLTDPAFDPLGLDARVSAECDQASGLFVSEAGTVSVSPPGPGGEVLFTITTDVASLPSVEFHWIAFAMEDASFTRLPASPDPGGWGIQERMIP